MAPVSGAETLAVCPLDSVLCLSHSFAESCSFICVSFVLWCLNITPLLPASLCTGYEITGQPSITCSAGSWGTPPTCSEYWASSSEAREAAIQWTVIRLCKMLFEW